jgi:hypothetical protein
MTHEEINLIYDYLHENYEYVAEGHLIRRFDLARTCKRKGDRLGSFFYHTNSEPYLMSSVTVNKKRYRMKLIKLIFIYHKKHCPSRIYQIDKNPMNTRIENLEEVSHSIIQHRSKMDKGNKKIPMVKNKDGTEGHSVRIPCDGKQLNLGTYRTKELAEEVYSFAKNLIIEDHLHPAQIKKIIIEKYPVSSLNKKALNK